MTTGSRSLTNTYNASYLAGVSTEGIYFTKSWTGGDSVSSKKTLIASIKRNPPPMYPDTVNRKPNENSAAFKRRVRKLRAEWFAQRRLWILKNLKDKAVRLQKRPKKRAMTPNNYSVTVHDHYYGNYLVKKGSDSEYRYVMNGNRMHVGHTPLDPKDHYRLIEKLRRRVYGSGFHPGITAAESPKALKMIFQSAKQIRLGLYSLATGNWRGIVRNLGNPTDALYGKARHSYLSFREGRMTLSQAWLAFYYGWKPLLQDMEEASAYIAEQLYGNGAALGRRVQARRTFNGLKYNRTTNPGFLQFGMADAVTTHQCQYVITNLRADTPSAVPPVASLAGVAWEIMPYSFVVDWVAPIGGYLQALRTASQIKGTVVLSVKSDTTWSNLKLGPGLTAYKQVSPLPTRWRYTTFSRTVSDEISPPTPLGDLSPGSVFSIWERAASAVALLQNLRIGGLDSKGFLKTSRKT